MSEDTEHQMNEQEVALVEAAITAIDSSDGPPIAMVVGDVNQGEMALLCVAILVPGEYEKQGRKVLSKAIDDLRDEIALIQPIESQSTH